MNKKQLAGLQRDTTHPTEEELMLLLDGELEQRRAEELRDHLAGCWNCRARHAEFEQTVFAFVKGRNAALEPFAQAPPRAEARFLQRLQQAAEADARPSVFARWRYGWASFALSTTGKLRLSVAACVSVLLVAAGLWLTRETTVSASELLDRAERAEQSSLAQVAEPVSYRQVRVARRSAGQVMTSVWESWRDARGRRSQQRFADEHSAARELARVLAANQLDAESPLSVAAFTRWRQQTRRESETVTALGNVLRLTTVVAPPHPPNAIIEASLTVRRDDWHAVSQSFKVQNAGEVLEYELTEMAFEVLPLQALTAFAETAPAPTATPARAATDQLTAAITPSPTPSAMPLPALPTAAALQEAEIAASYALHQLNADLGEPLEITRDGNRQIIVRGLVETAERKQQLTEALRGLPLVNAQIQTVAEAVQQHAQPNPQLAPAPSATGANAPVEPFSTNVAPPAMNLWQQRLEQHFAASGLERPAASRRATQFSNAVFAEAAAALSEAWALRRLAERYQTLPESDAARLRLEEIQNNHLARLRTRSRTLHAQLDPLLASLGAASTSGENDGEKDEASVIRLFRTVERFHQLSSLWFVGTGVAGESPARAARQLSLALMRLDAALQNFK